MPVLNRSADRFQRALEGERVSDAQLARLVETSRHLAGLGPQGPAPDPAFVATLRERLTAEAARMPAVSPAAARAAAARRAAARTAPVVVVLGRGTPRLVAGALASTLLVGGIVGAASRSALPGDALYPVKGWLDGIQVRLADNDLDRGRTYLDLAQEHISDARDLAEQDEGADDVNVSLGGAIESVRRGQRSLDSAYTATGNPQALIAMRDFTARALPQVDALRTEVPAGSLPLLGQLEALLLESREATARRIAACGTPCAQLATTLGPASLPSLPTTATGSSTAATGDAAATSPVPVPTGGGVAGPSVSAGGDGLGAAVGGGGASLSSDSASVGLPTISASVPIVPSVTASVPLPSVSLGSTGVTATVPQSTLGSVTLPGASVTLP